MKIKLLTYDRRECWVDIPDDTEEIKIQVLSGDMILLEPFHYDTDIMNDRICHFDDGTYIIKKEKFNELNKITDSYDIEDF